MEEELRAWTPSLTLRPRTGYGLLHASLWGNRTDGGFNISAGESRTSDVVTSALVADDSATLRQLPPAGTSATVAVVADDAGRELISILGFRLRDGRAWVTFATARPEPM